jgi:hypothetical protein
MATIPRALDAGWLGVDFFFIVVPLFIDAGTGAWYNFDGVSITFPDSDSMTSVAPLVESYEPHKLFQGKSGIVLLASTGNMGPNRGYFVPILYVNEFLFGVGYDLSNRLLLAAEWSIITDINLLSANTKYTYDHSDLSSYQLQLRFSFIENLFGSLGGGITSASVDHIYYYDENGIRHLESGTSKSFPTAFAAIGYSGRTGFVELRHTLGFGSMTFPNGEPFEFESTSLNFGFNFHF